MDPHIKQHVDAVTEYLGHAPDFREIAFLNDTDWQSRFGKDSNILGKTGAIFTHDRDILLRGNGKESLLHELLHAAGLEEGTIGSEFNEGFTELVAREIASEYKLPPTVSGYQQLVLAVKTYVLPLVTMSLQELAKQYAAAPDKSKLLAQMIAKRHSHHFHNREDWGDDADSPQVMQEKLERVFRTHTFNPWPYLEYLVHDVLPQNETFARFLSI